MTADQRPSLVDYRGNGKPPKPTFSAGEMQGRQDKIRGWMAKSNVDACLFTSYHNICYLAGFSLLFLRPQIRAGDHPEGGDHRERGH